MVDINAIKKVVVREVYTVDTISKTNVNAWEVLMRVMEEDNQDTLFDFRGIEVVEPWLNETFKKFIGNEKVYIKMYSAQKAIDTINLACKIGGIKSGRFFNEDIVAPIPMSAEEKKILNMARQLQSYFEDEDGVPTLKIYKSITQIGSETTVRFIEEALKLYHEENNVNRLNLDLDTMFVQSNIIKMVSNMEESLLLNGINLSVISKDKETMNKIGLYQNVDSTLSLNDKYTIVKTVLEVGTVGMLTKYKRSRAIDEFGRQGKGEAVSCRVAIFKGFGTNSSGATCLQFITFNGNTFYTKEHWALENDNEELEGLEVEHLSIPLVDIGILDKYLGSKYHFMLPIQYEEEDRTLIYSLEDGKVVHNKLTIPERIKVVFDDWGIDCNRRLLDEAIAKTAKILAEKQ